MAGKDEPENTLCKNPKWNKCNLKLSKHASDQTERSEPYRIGSLEASDEIYWQIVTVWWDGQYCSNLIRWPGFQQCDWLCREIQDCPLGVKIESVVFLRKRRLIDRVGTVRLQPLSGCQLFQNSLQHNLNRHLLAFFSTFPQHLILLNSLFNVIRLGFPVLWPWENTGNSKIPKKFLSWQKVKTLFQPPPPALGPSSGEQAEEGQSLSSSSGRWT